MHEGSSCRDGLRQFQSVSTATSTLTEQAKCTIRLSVVALLISSPYRACPTYGPLVAGSDGSNHAMRTPGKDSKSCLICNGRSSVFMTDEGRRRYEHRLGGASVEHRGSAAKRDSMKKRPSWTPTYKISALCQLHPLVGRRRRSRAPCDPR